MTTKRFMPPFSWVIYFWPVPRWLTNKKKPQLTLKYKSWQNYVNLKVYSKIDLEILSQTWLPRFKFDDIQSQRLNFKSNLPGTKSQEGADHSLGQSKCLFFLKY